MSRKIALVTSGAVSLGSYEAGVLYELFEIFRLYAGRCAKEGREVEYEVDVLAGASAGSVNSVIYGLAAVYDPKLIHSMKEVWLDGLDITKLTGKGSFSPYSIFSDTVIKNLKTGIIRKLKKRADVPPGSHLPARMKVGLTLANLSGIPYMVSFSGSGDTRYKLTTFADWYPFDLARDEKNEEQIKDMLDAATASGAFPFAFPACKLRRSRADYPNTALPGSGDELEFIYVDGGIFNNEPVNRAKELAQEIGKEYKKKDPAGSDGMPDRIYLLIDPTPPEDVGTFDKDPDMAAVGQRLVTAILSEAHFRDWNDAVKINQRIAWQDRFLLDIYGAFSGMAEGPLKEIHDTFFNRAREIIDFKVLPIHKEKVLQDDKALPERKEEYRRQNEDRIWRSLIEKLEKKKEEVVESNREMNTELRIPVIPQKDSLLGRTIVNFVFVMECIGALREKIKLDIRPLFPAKNELLAGKFWGSFGGFLCRDFRAHDFNVGRRTAREFALLSKERGGLGLKIDFELRPIPEKLKDLQGRIEDVPLECRIMIRDKLIAGLDKGMAYFIRKHWRYIAAAIGILSVIIAALELAFKSVPLAVVAVLILLLGMADFFIRLAVRSKLKKDLDIQLRI